MKKILALGMAAVMAASLGLAGCGSSAPSTSETQAAGEAAPAEGGIRLVNNKVEIDAALKELAAKYQEETIPGRRC